MSYTNDEKRTTEYAKLRKEPKNTFLLEKAQEKYEKFSKLDPFPEIGDALLNSVDILKYVEAVGMITPFNINRLEGVTYTCHFSGEYHYWDGDKKHSATLAESDPPLRLRSNSIVYLKIEEEFRIPHYLIFRYNLEVSHVYKGLLLGTGPIVDPGFTGHLYIPLHNLTSNEYEIKKGASLITLEFTKVGRNGQHWPPSGDYSEKMSETNFDFSSLTHTYKYIPPDRSFDVYIDKALKGDRFYKVDSGTVSDIPSVSSSIPNKIIESVNTVKDAEKLVKAAEQSASEAHHHAGEAEKKVTRLISLGIGAAALAVVAMVLTIFAMFNDINSRIDEISRDNFETITQNLLLERENELLRDEIASLESRLLDIYEHLQINNECADD